MGQILVDRKLPYIEDNVPYHAYKYDDIIYVSPELWQIIKNKNQKYKITTNGYIPIEECKI